MLAYYYPCIDIERFNALFTRRRVRLFCQDADNMLDIVKQTVKVRIFLENYLPITIFTVIFDMRRLSHETNGFKI